MANAIRNLETQDRLDALAARLQELAGPLDSGRVGEILRGDWLGHALHPLLTDLPLGLWLGTGMLDLFGGKRSRPAAQQLLGMGLLLVPPTVAAGLVDGRRATEPRSRRVVAAHAVTTGAVATLYLLSWRARIRNRHARGVALALLGGSLAWVSGYLGGHLSFGLGIGTGTRGFTENAHEPRLDIRDAADLLGVSVEQVAVMLDEEMIVTASGDGSTPYFRRTDVLAVRLAGG
jgi:uncharacterized membrane protein